MTQPVPTIADYVNEYVSQLETALTQESCKCDWITVTSIDVVPVKKIRGTASLKCPVHTKEGLILGFIDWLVEKHPWGAAIADSLYT